MRYIITLIVLFYLISGCDNPEAFDCIKKTGDVITLEVTTHEFTKILVRDDIELHVKQGDFQQVKVIGGKNLVPNVVITENGEWLEISNGNTCRWTRDYDPLIVEITTNNLRGIESQGYGPVKSLNTILNDDLVIESKDGSGDFVLDVEVEKLKVVNNSISNITISGTSNYSIIGHWYNDGIFYGEQLFSDALYIHHHGVNLIKTNVTEELIVNLTSSGNFLYNGNPLEMSFNVSGSGQIIKY